MKNNPIPTTGPLDENLRETESLTSSTIESLLYDIRTGLEQPAEDSPRQIVGEEICIALERTAGRLEGAPARMLVRVEGILGAGNFGSVVRVRDADTGAVYALKRLHAGSARQQGSRQCLLREFTAAASIAHPRLVGVHGYGHHECQPCLLLDCVETWPRHPTLQHLLDDVGVLPLGKAARIGRDVAQGLAELHGHGVIHRDLKPANVLLDRRRRAVLVDYGLAYDLNEEAYLSARAFKGTVVYAAPEVCAGATPTPRADLYALGVILFETLTGTWPHPFHEMDGSLAAVFRLKARPPTRDITDLEPAIPPELAQLVRSLLAVEPRARQGDALNVAAALEEYTEVEA